MTDGDGPKRKASEHFRQVSRELNVTPAMGSLAPGADSVLSDLDRSRFDRLRLWNELLECERDAADPVVKKLASVLRQLLGRSHGP